MKKIICAFLSVVMLLTAVSAYDFSVFAEDTATQSASSEAATEKTQLKKNVYSSGFVYNERKGGRAVIKKYYGEDTNVVIPSEIDGLSVTSIAKKAFYENDKITSVTVSEGILNIGIQAFACCSNLASVVLPEGLEIIEDGAFEWTKLESIVIPEGVEFIGEYAFAYCKSLKNVTFPSSLECIDGYAFRRSGIKKAVFPEGLKSIRKYAFYGCDSLAEISFPDSLEHIGLRAFFDCDKLKSVVIPKNIYHLRKYAFCDCDKLSDVTIEGRIFNFKYGVFSGCPIENLTVMGKKYKTVGKPKAEIISKKQVIKNFHDEDDEYEEYIETIVKLTSDGKPVNNFVVYKNNDKKSIWSWSGEDIDETKKSQYAFYSEVYDGYDYEKELGKFKFRAYKTVNVPCGEDGSKDTQEITIYSDMSNSVTVAY